MATFVIRYPSLPSPVAFAHGDFWNQDRRLTVDVGNASAKAIRAMRLHLEYLSPVVQDLHGFAHEWSVGPLAPGETTTVHFERYFEESGLVGYFHDEKILGWVVHPTLIEYADGTSWKPREHGEAFTVFWRDAEHAEQLEALPPLQPDQELPEEHPAPPR